MFVGEPFRRPGECPTWDRAACQWTIGSRFGPVADLDPQARKLLRASGADNYFGLAVGSMRHCRGGWSSGACVGAFHRYAAGSARHASGLSRRPAMSPRRVDVQLLQNVMHVILDRRRRGDTSRHAHSPP